MVKRGRGRPKGSKCTPEGCARIAESKRGDKNPAKRPEVREKLRRVVLEAYAARRLLMGSNDA